MHKLKKVGSKLSEEDQRTLAQFKKKYQHLPEFKEIETKLKLLEYDDATSDEERHKVISDLASSKFLNLTFDYQKPEDIQRLESSSSQAEDESEKDDRDDEMECEEGEYLDVSGEGNEYGDEYVLEQEQVMQQEEQMNINNDLFDYDDEIRVANAMPQIQ